MRKIIAFALFLLLPSLAFTQSDTTLVAFKKLFKKRIPLPYLVSYTDKEFVMDSLRSSMQRTGYIKYRMKLLKKDTAMQIPAYMVKRFLKLDTLLAKKVDDTCYTEFFALGTLGVSRSFFALVVERQIVCKDSRISEKFLCTVDKKYRQIDTLRLASEIPGDRSIDESDPETERFNGLPWFRENIGVVQKNLAILLENEIGKVRRAQVKGDGHLVKKP